MTEKRPFSSKNILGLTNLTYRTLTDWDAKGLLPAGREGDKGWRRYSIEDAFVTLVFSEIRTQFGVPIIRLLWLKERMSEYDGGCLPKVLGLMQAFGAAVFILTDLKSYFRICSFMELLDLILDEFFEGEDKEGFILLRINPLVNRLLGALDAPELESHGLGYVMYDKAREKNSSQTPSEKELLEMVREKAHTRIEVRMENGTVAQSSPVKDLGRLTPEELMEALESADHQTLTIHKQGGAVTGVRQKLPGKPAKKHKRGSSRRRK